MVSQKLAQLYIQDIVGCSYPNCTQLFNISLGDEVHYCSVTVSIS